MVLLKKTGTHKRLGEMLVETGIITSEQLQEALEEQKKSGGRLGQNLMALGYITEDVMAAFVGKQLGISYVSLSEYGEISVDVTKIVPENICRHQTLVPISMEDNILTIAMADPLNVFTVDDLRVMTGYEIKVVISSEAEIKQAIEKYYGNKGSMEDILKTMDDGKGGTLEVVTQEEEQVDIASLEAAGEEAPVVKIVNLILTGAVKSGASDIHIEPFEKSLRTRYRIDGVLHEISSPPKRLTSAIISRIKIMANLDIAERRLPQDGRIKVKVIGKEIDLRVSILPTAFGEKVVMRILDASSLCLDLTKLGFEPDVLPIYQKHIEIPYGICLVTGPTGSGKSTTLYSSLSTLNYPDRNIMTIEDPVEYVLEGINQVQAKPDIGLTFAAGLRSFLRQDPDIIMVGEIRDAETAEIAINAALTGHLVFSTLHTNDASGAVTRLTNMGIEPFLTASTVVMVIAQRLVRVICENCKEDYQVPAQFIRDLGQKYEDDKPVLLYRGKGCERCTNTGYRGRLAVYEIMIIDDEIRDLILERASTHLVKQKSREHGMITLRDAAFRKVLAGVTTVEEMMRVTFADAA